MAKRFTDTEKWKDPFFYELTSDYKLVWIYLLDDCNHAGVWKKSIKRLNFDCGTHLSEEDILKTFGDRIVVISEDKWFIPKFMFFQHGKDFTKSKQKTVISALKILNELDLLITDNKGNVTLKIPYTNPMDTLNVELPNSYGTGNSNVYEKDNENSIGKGYGKGYGKEIDKIFSEILNQE